MIRWLVIGLVLANVLYFALMQWGGKLSGESWQAPPLAELNPDKVKLLNVPPAPPAIPVAALEHAASAVPATETVAPVAPSVTPAIATPAAVQAVPSHSETPVPVAPKPPVVPAPVPADTAAEAKCMEWGEFSGSDLTRATQALAGLKLGNKLGQRAVEYKHGYLVYLAPFKTAAGKTKKIRELKAAGVSDYFIIKESGQLKNAISLGVFKTEEAAKHFRTELGKKGLKSVQVGPREAKLKFTVFTLRQLDTAVTGQLTALQKDFPGSELKSLACQDGGK